MSRRRFHTGFTLVEMLVVIGIIAVLAALLLPAVMSSIMRARNTVIALEVKQLDTGIEAYRLEKGDYPPNFRDLPAVTRHIAKCYPRIDPTYAANFVRYAYAQGSTPDLFIDEGESLVFWLSLTDTNPQYPFLSYYNPNPVTASNPNGLTPNPKKYYDFDQTRLIYGNPAGAGSVSGVPGLFYEIPSFQAKYCKETYYIYIDSRSYDELTVDFGPSPPSSPVYAYAEDFTVGGVRPYWSATVNTSLPTATLNIYRYKAVNPTTFQIICAGQDGDFGALATNVKVFPAGTLYDKPGDYDNITNFSNGRTLGDSIP